MEHKKNRLLTLFTAMLSISAFTFGGGFVIVTLMKRRFVEELHWFTEEEMLDMTAIAQSCPGAIAVNAAILAGQRAAGAAGAASAVLGTIIPPVVTLSIITTFYALLAENPYFAALLSGMQAGVAAVITDVALGLGERIVGVRNPLHLSIMVIAFAAAFFFHVNVIWVVLVCAGIGVLCALLKKGEKA